MADDPAYKESAPVLSVPDVPIVSLEHPCVVQNLGKAIRMFGAGNEIADILAPGNDKPLGLRFQPEDATSREIVSYAKKTDNLLLKVTVPKRTGRKRKRGSQDEFASESGDSFARKDSRYLIRSLTDNIHEYEAEIVGQIHSTHVWRAMPDFVYSSKGSTFLNDVKTKLLSQSYPKLKQRSLPRKFDSASADTEAIPPPMFSSQSLPYTYQYNQNQISKPGTAKQIPQDRGTPEEALPKGDGLQENGQADSSMTA